MKRFQGEGSQEKVIGEAFEKTPTVRDGGAGVMTAFVIVLVEFKYCLELDLRKLELPHSSSPASQSFILLIFDLAI